MMIDVTIVFSYLDGLFCQIRLPDSQQFSLFLRLPDRSPFVYLCGEKLVLDQSVQL
jgi:hypothetical protein